MLLRIMFLWKRSVLSGITVTPNTGFASDEEAPADCSIILVTQRGPSQGWILTPSPLKARLKGIGYGWVGWREIAVWDRQGV